MKRILILLIAAFLLAGCQRMNTVNISGSVKEKKQEYLSLYKVDINTPVLIDSVKIRKNGMFSIRVKTSEPDFYQFGYKDDFITLLASPGEKIRITFSGPFLYTDYTITGSEGSELVRTLDLKLIETKNKIDSINLLYNKALAGPDSVTRGPELEKAYMDIIGGQRKFNIAFIINNISSLAAIKALYQRIDDETYVLYQNRDLQYLKIVSDSLKKHYPDSKHTKALLSNFENELNQFYSNQIRQISETIPETILNPDLKDINGKKIALSSLRGKYVLLTFWSADSRECIAENLQFKEFYRNYNKRGFEIYQINLDQDEEKWKASVKFDELPWISTREDDPANPVTARLYNVQTLPANYLYDPEGKIIASNLHGRNLQIKLNQIFNY